MTQPHLVEIHLEACTRLQYSIIFIFACSCRNSMPHMSIFAICGIRPFGSDKTYPLVSSICQRRSYYMVHDNIITFRQERARVYHYTTTKTLRRDLWPTTNLPPKEPHFVSIEKYVYIYICKSIYIYI